MRFLDWFRGRTRGRPCTDQNHGAEADRCSHRLNDDASYNATRDLVSGLEFVATLQIRTPLSVLQHHGAVFCGLPSQAPRYGTESDGTWIPKTKSWKELGINLRELPESTCASDVGPVRPSEYLPFLMDFRAIVEQPLDVSTKLDRLRQLIDANPQYREFWDRLARYYEDFPHSFFYMELTVIPGIGATTARSLYQAGFRCLTDLRNASQDELGSVRGVGKVTLKKLSEYLQTGR